MGDTPGTAAVLPKTQPVLIKGFPHPALTPHSHLSLPRAIRSWLTVYFVRDSGMETVLQRPKRTVSVPHISGAWGSIVLFKENSLASKGRLGGGATSSTILSELIRRTQFAFLKACVLETQTAVRAAKKTPHYNIVHQQSECVVCERARSECESPERE